MTESPTSRENRLAEVFVALADTLVTDFDIADLFHDLAGACVELLEVTAAGLMLVDAGGRLRVMSSSSERSRLLELMEIQNDEGPCLDCHREGAPVLVADLAAQRARWPGFAEEAIRVGFGAVYALPMRLRSDTIGALNLFHRDPDTITDATLRIGQALADVATIAILQQRAAQAREELSPAATDRVEQQGHHRAGQRRARRTPTRRHVRPPSACCVVTPAAPTSNCLRSRGPWSPVNWAPTSCRPPIAPNTPPTA